MVRVKSNLDGDIRRFHLKDSPTLNDLREKIGSVYAINDFTIKYKDDDGDLVTITSDGELLEAVSEMDKKDFLRINIIKTDSSQPVQLSASTEPREAVSAPSPEVESFDRAPDLPANPESVEATTDGKATPERNDESAAGNSANGPDADGSRPPNTNAEPNLEEVLTNMVRMAAQVLSGESSEGSWMNNEASREDDDARTSSVPRPTLGFGSAGNEVRLLQKVLTNLGYMTPADYRMRSGLYGPRTANGVVRFRMECGLGYGMYDEAAAAALRSLVETGVPTTMASGGASQNTETNVQAEEKTEA